MLVAEVNGPPPPGVPPPGVPVPRPSKVHARRQGIFWIVTAPVSTLADQPDLPECAAWIRGQRELGAGGLDHWQFIVAFKKKTSLAGILQLYPRCHAELTRSNAAAEYVWKESTRVDGTQFECGVKPIQRNSKLEWESIWESAKSGAIEEIPASIRIQSYRAIRSIGADYAVALPVVRRARLFTGVTGSGKSHAAWAEFPGAFPKDPRTKWWTGYQGQTAVIIDEFRGGVDISHLLRWLDKYPCLVETKGSSMPLSATDFILTSNTEPSQWYPELDVVTMAALMRRLEITYFNEPYVEI